MERAGRDSEPIAVLAISCWLFFVTVIALLSAPREARAQISEYEEEKILTEFAKICPLGNRGLVRVPQRDSETGEIIKVVGPKPKRLDDGIADRLFPGTLLEAIASGYRLDDAVIAALEDLEAKKETQDAQRWWSMETKGQSVAVFSIFYTDGQWSRTSKCQVAGVLEDFPELTNALPKLEVTPGTNGAISFSSAPRSSPDLDTSRRLVLPRTGVEIYFLDNAQLGEALGMPIRDDFFAFVINQDLQ